MLKHKVTQKNISETLGITVKSVNEKVNGHTEFTLSEIQMIQMTYFSDLPIDYLFKREN